jgi:hypothetical protein
MELPLADPSTMERPAHGILSVWAGEYPGMGRRSSTIRGNDLDGTAGPAYGSAILTERGTRPPR